LLRSGRESKRGSKVQNAKDVIDDVILNNPVGTDT
jgi:hypothetical protein